MGCRCNERRAAILSAMKKPTTALTVAKFVAKTSAEDLASVASNTQDRVLKRLQRRG